MVRVKPLLLKNINPDFLLFGSVSICIYVKIQRVNTRRESQHLFFDEY